jgi:hypothetical protein
MSSKLLRATTTPLASIFGSGFLVMVPILHGAVGPYALPAIAGVCGVAYAVGWVIRHNIGSVEPGLENGTAASGTLALERVSDVAIVIAYVISVCLYLRILSSFLLGGLGVDSVLHEKMLTSGVIAVIGVVGIVRGLGALERLESWALWVTLVIIAAMIVGFGWHDAGLLSDGGIRLPAVPSKGLGAMLAILGGTLITVQGFETSRYMEEEYDAETRIRSCRLAQIIATCVYLLFVALATPLMVYLSGPVRDDALISLAGRASFLLPVPLVAAAVLSQFSAAVADTLGGEGNMVEASRGRISHRAAYALIAGGALVLAWSASTLEIVALASRAFAFYYMAQCLVGFSAASGTLRRSAMLLIALLMLAVTLFASPVG